MSSNIEISTNELISILFDLLKAKELERAHKVLLEEKKKLRNSEYYSRFKEISEINQQILRIKINWNNIKPQIEFLRKEHYENNSFFNEKFLPDLEDYFNSHIARLRQQKKNKSLKR